MSAPSIHDPSRQIHPTTVISSGAQLGHDCAIGPYAIIGDEVVLDPFPPKRPRVSERGLVNAGQPPSERLARFVNEAGLSRVRVEDLAVRLGILPADVTSTIAEAGKSILSVGDVLASRRAIAAEVERLATVVATPSALLARNAAAMTMPSQTL